LDKNVKIPSYAYKGDAGLDLYSNEEKILIPNYRTEIKTGIAIEIPKDYVGLVWDKGSLPLKHGIKTMGGVFDSGFRGEYKIILVNLSSKPFEIKKGMKIAQLLIQKVEHSKIIEAKKLSPTERGEKRLGSSGKF